MCQPTVGLLQQTTGRALRSRHARPRSSATADSTSSWAGSYLHSSFQTAFERGVAGWRDDDRAFLAGWGFGVADVTVPVLIVQGSEDRMVPLAHGSWLAAHVPGSEYWPLDGEGHLSIWSRASDFVEWLDRRARTG